MCSSSKPKVEVKEQPIPAWWLSQNTEANEPELQLSDEAKEGMSIRKRRLGTRRLQIPLTKKGGSGLNIPKGRN